MHEPVGLLFFLDFDIHAMGKQRGEGFVILGDDGLVSGVVAAGPGNCIVFDGYGRELSFVNPLKKIIKSDHGNIFRRLLEHVEQ